MLICNFTNESEKQVMAVLPRKKPKASTKKHLATILTYNVRLSRNIKSKFDFIFSA